MAEENETKEPGATGATSDPEVGGLVAEYEAAETAEHETTSAGPSEDRDDLFTREDCANLLDGTFLLIDTALRTNKAMLLTPSEADRLGRVWERLINKYLAAVGRGNADLALAISATCIITMGKLKGLRARAEG